MGDTGGATNNDRVGVELIYLGVAGSLARDSCERGPKRALQNKEG